MHLPRLGSTRRRRQGAPGTPWCRLRLRPARLLLRPSACPEPPRSAPRRPRGDTSRRHPPLTARCHPARLQLSAASELGKRLRDPRSDGDQGPRRGTLQDPIPSRPSGTFRHPRTALGVFFFPPSYCAILWYFCYFTPVVGLGWGGLRALCNIVGKQLKSNSIIDERDTLKSK